MRKHIVVDSSLVLSWCFQDENSDIANRLRRALIKDVILVVPSLWLLEISNVLLVSERKGRISEEKSLQFLSFLKELPINFEIEDMDHAFSSVIGFARKEGLSSYNAAYLELAVRKGLPIATLDQQIQKAATKLGVALFS
ncbi:MAG: type II toxin-antitoxin system VapC family toxin [Elusimicrobiota bacterium]